MTMTDANPAPQSAQPIPFKAETRQLLDILIHSLYTEREIFLRELISNASDALTRVDFEILTNRAVVDPGAELGIWLIADAEKNTLTIRDTGIGMTEAELVENLGTIAHSGVRDFIAAAKESTNQGSKNLSDLIGQFGVGFYSAFMVAEMIQVISRSYQPGSQAAVWSSTGADTFTVAPAEKTSRGTEVIIQLKEDAREFAQDHRLREIVRRHSEFIPYPIYLQAQRPASAEARQETETEVQSPKFEQINQRTALWRRQPRQVEAKEYEDFYKQLTLEFDPPLAHAHMVVDAPVQMYALLFLPARAERGLFSTRKEDGLKLYARKVLIQEYCKDLLPEYLRFVDGVVDSEDLPLNVSRESVQSNRVMAQLKKLVTNKVVDSLQQLAKDDPQKYATFWKEFSRFIKQGIAIEPAEPETLYPLLRFRTTAQPDAWCSLDDYVSRLQPDQKAIYYILSDDEHSALYSPHLDLVKRYNYEVLILTDPLDSFVLVRLKEYQGHPLSNVAAADLELPKTEPEQPGGDEAVASADLTGLIERFKAQLGERVAQVRSTNRLSDSPARLVDAEGAPNQEMQRVMRLLKQDFAAPKKVLELNPQHPLITRLQGLEAADPRSALVIEQIYENALLIEGLHPDPAGMIGRIQQLMQAALE
jgi:molecular chaperone HtpG